MLNVWRGGNKIGTIYKITKEEINKRMGCNTITVGNIPLSNGSFKRYSLDKKRCLQEGDLLLCTAHAGDCFYYYELLGFVPDNIAPDFPLKEEDKKGQLKIVQGMRVGAYTLSKEADIQLSKEQLDLLLKGKGSL